MGTAGLLRAPTPYRNHGRTEMDVSRQKQLPRQRHLMQSLRRLRCVLEIVHEPFSETSMTRPTSDQDYVLRVIPLLRRKVQLQSFTP